MRLARETRGNLHSASIRHFWPSRSFLGATFSIGYPLSHLDLQSEGGLAAAFSRSPSLSLWGGQKTPTFTRRASFVLNGAPCPLVPHPECGVSSKLGNWELVALRRQASPRYRAASFRKRFGGEQKGTLRRAGDWYIILRIFFALH